MDNDLNMTEMEGAACCTTATTALLIQQSKDKLEAAAEALKPWIFSSDDSSGDTGSAANIRRSSCTVILHSTSQQDAYRCRCSFQLLLLQKQCDDDDDDDDSNVVVASTWRYAIRRDKHPIVIDSFSIANHRIQKAMRRLLFTLNDSNGSSSSKSNNNVLTQHLTSVSFSSPWQDDDDDDENDDDENDDVLDIDSNRSRGAGAVIVVTLHYDGPIADETSWKDQARRICQTCGFAQLTGRSKNIVVRALTEGDDDDDDDAHGARCSRIITRRRQRPSSIHDTLWLEKVTNTSTSTATTWDVTFWKNPNDMASPWYDDHDSDNDGMKTTMRRIPVHYCKPEGAFFHPNASVMKLALKWLLNRVQYIFDTTATNGTTPTAHVRQRRPRLLELYCGCGAHTIPLALSGLFSRITALELDERLVRALKHNCRLNNLAVLAENDDHDKNDMQQRPTDDGCSTVVECVSADAGTWARRQQRKLQQKHQQRRQENNDDLSSCPLRNDEESDEYNILLVDPPRNGLDEQVCRLSLGGASSSSSSLPAAAAFSHILYISCGKQALLRDLERLSTGYELVDCAILDLFPQTEAVETLVHLQRR
jgi:tRNA/tmRNA/rRNA uracil-C5-methylase (TrmA/RlmC/RlmD family)